MKVKLLKDIFEYDRHGENVGIKVVKRRNNAWGPPVEVHGQLVKSQEPEFITTSFTAGTVIEMSDASGQKYIEAGNAVLAE